MTNVMIRTHSEFRDEVKPLEEALQNFVDAAEGYYGYILGNPHKCEQNYIALLWAANNLAGQAARLRPMYDFGYNEEQDAALHKLMDGPPYPPVNPYSTDRE